MSSKKAFLSTVILHLDIGFVPFTLVYGLIIAHIFDLVKRIWVLIINRMLNYIIIETLDMLLYQYWQIYIECQ